MPGTVPSFGTGVIVGGAEHTNTGLRRGHGIRHLPAVLERSASILRHEILPASPKIPIYLATHTTWRSCPGQATTPHRAGHRGEPRAASTGHAPGAAAAGPKNSLGLVKFVFPNDDNVYMHGTPRRQLFRRARRDFSHGCIRVENPVGLAEWVLRDQPDWTRERILYGHERHASHASQPDAGRFR